MKMCMAANWKMFKTRGEAVQTVKELLKRLDYSPPQDREVLIIPPFTAISTISPLIKDFSGFSLGAQNFYPADQGAYTGEISPNMLLDLDCQYALAGHSERRHIFQESDDLIGAKVKFGLKKGLKMILCIGETLEERKADQIETVLQRQLEKGLQNISEKNIQNNLCIAYEPVWAIGTGEVAGPKDIEEAHAYVRGRLKSVFPQEGDQVRILYGGSVKTDNCSEIIAIDKVNGLLIGGAGLQADSFSQIITAAAS